MYVPESVAAYFHQRLTEVMEALVTAGSLDTVVQYGYVVPTSAEMRILLALESIDILRSNIWIGIGAFRSEELLYAGTGIQNVAHNTYLEIALTGGLLGILFLVLYFLPLLRILVRTPELLRRYQRRDLVLVSLMLYMVFSVGFVFLSLNYNSILYLPVVVGLAFRTYSSREWDFASETSASPSNRPQDAPEFRNRNLLA
jgi:O-antigen ligase